MGLFSAIRSLFAGCDKRDPKSPAADGQSANTDEFLFGMATICDELPPSDGHAKIPAEALQMHEDYWRQVEFVSSASMPQAEKMLKEFLAFREAHRRGVGFTETYIRKNVYPSLEALQITRREVSTAARPLIIYGALVVGGFAVSDGSGAYLYGHSFPDGTVKYLGIEPPSDKAMSRGFTKRIAELAQKHGLVLIDWYKGALVEEITEDTLAQWAAMYKTAQQGDQAEHQ